MDSLEEFKKIKASLVIQTNFRNIIKYVDNLNEEIRELYEAITSIMANVQENYDNKILRKEKYNKLMEKLDDLLNEFKSFPSHITVRSLTNLNKYEVHAKIKMIQGKIKEIAEECGTENCSDLVRLFCGSDVLDSLSVKYKHLLSFYDRFFVSISCTCLSNPSDIKLALSGKGELLPFAKKSSSDSNLKSFTEKIEGADVYFPFENNLLVVCGYFKKDPLNLTRIGGTFEHKFRRIVNLSQYISVADAFKTGFLDQINIRDFLIYEEKELVQMIEESYNELLKYRGKPLSVLVREFISANIEKQRRILTLFLLSNSDDQFLAHIIYDMICNQSELLKPQPMAEEIYKSLHWSIQKLFRIAFKNAEKQKSKLMNLTEEDIPYEKRISLMKVHDQIKAKAMEKLKEIQGTRDSSAKAQNYLDGLLRIPFGTYKREPLLHYLEDFTSRLDSEVREMVDKMNQYHPINEAKNEIKEKILSVLMIHDKNIINTENTIDSFLQKLSSEIETVAKMNLVEDCGDISNEEVLARVMSEECDSPNKLIGADAIKECKFIEKINKIKEINSRIENSSDNQSDELFNKIENEIKAIESNLLKDLNSIDYFNNKPIKKIVNDDVIFQVQDAIVRLFESWVAYKADKRKYLKHVRKTLNESVYGHTESKLQIERLIAQWMNGKMDGQVFGFQGPPGVGKTTIAKKGLSKCLMDEDGNPRPFAFLPMGGSTNGAILEGHSYTYLGSTWGRIVDILMETKCMNPIIYIDEVDKVSQTEHGREIIGILTHLTDFSQNTEFTDKFFAGIKFDLSKVLFVFSYNDPHKIDPILRDRITEVNVKALTKNEKIHIANEYSLPEILEKVGYKKGDIVIDSATTEHLIETYTNEAGVRKLNEKIFEIVREINLQRVMDDDIKFPFSISKEYVDELFSDKPKVQVKKIAKSPTVGLVNGLYATSSGTGGITIVEVVKTPSDRKLSLELTGQQGDVMKESMACAKTLAWNLLPKKVKEMLSEEFEKFGLFGLHIHCPEAATPKDGPSAGITITTAILSRLCNVAVRNNIGMTGEVDLHGNVHPIGGLEAKIEGARKAGVTKVLFPKDNEDDYVKIVKRRRDMTKLYNSEHEDQIEFDEEKPLGVDVKIVSTIYEVIEEALVENDLEFVNFNEN